MRELMFDTSVYGELVDDESALIRIGEQVNVSFFVFGSSTVRQELEETPAITLVSRGKFKGLNLRELLLRVYRLFVEESGGEVLATDLVEVLALRYRLECKSSSMGKQMLNDFRVVASASLHNVGLFVSADKRQVSKGYSAVYLAVNITYQMETPELVLYADFKASPGRYSEEGNEAEEKEGAK